MSAYYNEIDPKAAAWLRELIKAGHIAPGIVDERSIEDVRPDELREFTQCHFFAGIGVWSYALRRAGWPDDRPVWTGSCPCQPFSAAGKGGGFVDERHLWPAWFHLITQCEPDTVFGEQVASKDGLGWLDLVQADLEGAGYANGATDICAAGVGSPKIRQRTWLVAERLAGAPSEGLEKSVSIGKDRENARSTVPGEVLARGSSPSGLASTDSNRRNKGWQRQSASGDDGPIGDGSTPAGPRQPGPTNGMWGACDWLACRDGKWRPVEPGTFPLAHGAPARVGRLRGYGNALNAEVATLLIKSYLEVAHV